MSVTLQVLVFCLAAAVSLATSYLLVTRLERIGERLGLSEALLGLVAALAADAPEITSAVSALAQHQQKVGAGVIIGSNVFNLAALLGLGAIVAGSIALHRRVVTLGGIIALWIAAVCLITTTGTIPPATSITQFRWNDDGTPSHVALPPKPKPTSPAPLAKKPPGYLTRPSPRLA